MNSTQPLQPHKCELEVINVTYSQTPIHKTSEKVLKDNRIITAHLPGKWLESYRMLRTRCLQGMDAMAWKTLAITSTSHEAGTSLTAANLAISIAMELNRTALLVDTNLQKPAIHHLFGLKNECGLSDYLLGDIELNSVLVNPGIDRLVLLPAGKPMLNSAEMLHSPKMQRLVTELKHRYPSRIIIFDLPPLLCQDDALGFAPHADCLLLVVDEGHTKSNDLKEAAHLLKDYKLLGTVFNKSTDNILPFNN